MSCKILQNFCKVWSSCYIISVEENSFADIIKLLLKRLWTSVGTGLSILKKKKQKNWSIVDLQCCEKYGMLHEFVCHDCTGAMLVSSILFQF